MKVNENMRSETIEPNQYERSAVDFEIAKFDISIHCEERSPENTGKLLALG